MVEINLNPTPYFPPTPEHSLQKKNIQDTIFKEKESFLTKDLPRENSIKNANNASNIPETKYSFREIYDFSADAITGFMGLMVTKNDTNRLETMTQDIERITKKIDDLTKKKLETINKNLEEQQKADEKNRKKSGGIFGWLKKIFKVIAAVLTVAVAAAATVATGGMATPLLVLSLLSLSSVVLGVVGEATGKNFDHITQWMDPGSLVGKGAGALAKTLGASDKDAVIVSATFAMVTTIAIMVCSVWLSGGLTAQDVIPKAVAIGTAVTGIVNGAMSITEGAADREIADIEKEIAFLQSQLQKILAQHEESSHQRAELTEDIKQLMNKINELPSILSEMLANCSKIISQTIANINSAHPA